MNIHLTRNKAIPTEGIMAKDILAHLRNRGAWVDQPGKTYDNTIVYTVGRALMDDDGNPHRHADGSIMVKETTDFVSLEAINMMEPWQGDTSDLVVTATLVSDDEPTMGENCYYTGAEVLPRTHVLAWGDVGCLYDTDVAYRDCLDAMDAAYVEIRNFEELGYTMVDAQLVVQGRRWPSSNVLRYTGIVRESRGDIEIEHDQYEGFKTYDGDFAEALERLHGDLMLPHMVEVALHVTMRKPGGALYVMNVFGYEG